MNFNKKYAPLAALATGTVMIGGLFMIPANRAKIAEVRDGMAINAAEKTAEASKEKGIETCLVKNGVDGSIEIKPTPKLFQHTGFLAKSDVDKVIYVYDANSGKITSFHESWEPIGEVKSPSAVQIATRDQFQRCIITANGEPQP